MNQLILLFSLLLSVFCHVEAQSSSSSQNNSLVVIIPFMILILLVSIGLAIFTRFCLRHGPLHNNQETPNGLLRPDLRSSSGIDRRVIESLPFFKFSSLKGIREGLECSVCLSKFQDIEILRLLPKCKHAFHIACIDQWLENHSSCPLCRQRISLEDLTCSISSRLVSSKSLVSEAGSNMELFVQREDSRREGSFSSFRKFEKGVVMEDELPIREACEGLEESDKFLHKFNHKIIMSHSVFRSRWSNLSSSDLLVLNSEMLGDFSSSRFSPLESKTLENNSNPLPSGADTSNPNRKLQQIGKRSMSEIVGQPRFKASSMRNSNSFRESNSVPENGTKEERLKRLWLPIAQKTVAWYSNRDKKMNYTRESLNV